MQDRDSSSSARNWGSNFWNGEATTIRAFAKVIDSTGASKTGVSVTFRLKNPGGSTVDTQTATTNSAGIASYIFNLNNQNYYGFWTAEATADGHTGTGQFISNWWGCAWCHGERSVDRAFGTWDNPSPFTMGYRFHQDPRKSDHVDLIAAGRCDFCHQVYDGVQEVRDRSEDRAGEATVYSAGIHRNKQQCEDCHPGAKNPGDGFGGFDGGSGSGSGSDPDIPDCFSCHPLRNQEVSSKSTLKNGKAFYGADETNGFMPNKAHSTGQNVPCITCHQAMHNITKPDPDPATSNAVTESSQCQVCHSPRTEHNNQVECRTCHTGDAHAIKFLSTSGTFTTDRGQAVNCPDCHQFNNLDSFLDSQGLTAPKVPMKFNHSEDPNAGQLWNETTPGYFGPWNVNGAGSNLPACLYCHGNTKHDSVALGRVNAALGGGNIIDGTISSTSMWCGSCHYPPNPFYNDMMAAFDDAGLERPPDNTNEAGPRFFDHTSILAGDASDAVCRGCHGALLSPTAKMTEFEHNVAVGAGGGPDCISCHDVGSPNAPKHVDFSVKDQSVHADLNNKSGDPGPTSSTDPSLSPNYACWGCHQSDGTSPEGMGDIYMEPHVCIDCHLDGNVQRPPQAQNAPIVYQHYKNGVNIKAATDNATVVLSCKECHNKDEMILPSSDPDDGTFDADEDGIFGGQQNYYHYGKPRPDLLMHDLGPVYTDCDYCHQNTSTAFASAMDVNATYHSNMPDHTDRPGGPGCADGCHGVGRIHDGTINKPATQFNNNFCIGCHFGFGQQEAHANDNPGSNSLFCADCHTDPFSNEKQIHGARYIKNDLTYGGPNDQTNAADCTSCHQQGGSPQTIGLLNNMPPQIPTDFAHSDNPNAGMLWNRTPGGFNGPWLPTSNNLNACLYCHGNKNPANTEVKQVIHAAKALGRVYPAFDDNGRIINGTID
ncbi:MAG: hypothetical protein ACYTBX_18660, partial [Planctomycetota bacterium]